MLDLHIELSRKNDKGKIFQKYGGKQIDEAICGGVGVLEHGTNEGKQSLMFFVEDPRDKSRVLLVQLTSRIIMEGLVPAMRGFMELCGELPKPQFDVGQSIVDTDAFGTVTVADIFRSQYEQQYYCYRVVDGHGQSFLCCEEDLIQTEDSAT